MSGAGSGVAGAGLAGKSAPASLAPRDVRPPRALYFDGASRDMLLVTATGLYRSLHPVDQKMAMALVLRRGSIPVAPDLGSTFHEIGIGEEEAMTADAIQRASQAAALLIQVGDVRITSVRCFSSRVSRVRVEVDYLNLRLAEEERAGSVALDI